MRLSFLILPLAVAGCATNWQVDSNLDPAAISDYFAPSSVAMIDEAEVGHRPDLGPVSGEACQASTNQPPVTAADARTALRRKAATLGAEAVVVGQCLELSGNDAPPDCTSLITCNGHAYGPEQPK